MADPIQSFLAANPQTEPTALVPRPRPRCCCGNEACTYLKNNQSALDDLERDVDTAARLGKALLARHEAYITDSEHERKAMAAQIEGLEAEKQNLEQANASVIEENRHLLDQLESLNNAVAQSDAHVTSLQATLASTQREMQKLAQLAARTENLERQLADFEREQATWQTSLEETEHSERTAVRRWQTAERTLAQLQEQIEQIEKEANEEKERHAEIVERMQRRHAVEKELGSAAGRLKGAAALKSGDKNAPSNGVVSHFVKDILQDNANLQMGIVELREMLNNSNEEVEHLRNQLSIHQPTDDVQEAEQSIVERKNLGAEMDRWTSQELHVHHHYHAPPPVSTTSKAQPFRRPRKKRYGAFTSGYATPPSGTSTPRSSFSHGTPTSAAAILQQTAVSIPQANHGRKRWSMQSTQTFHSAVTSSGPSSPTHTSSVYDRVFSDAGQDSSRPTTPDTEDPGSPVLGPIKYPIRAPSTWARTHSAPLTHRHALLSSAARPSLDAIVSIEELPKLEQSPGEQEDAIPEEHLDSNQETETESIITSPLSEDLPDPHTITASTTPGPDTFFLTRPPLRRAGSHESLLSISGMDIHTLKSRPAQLLAPYAGRALTSQAVLSDTNAHAARPVAMSRTSTTGRSILTGMAADQRLPAGAATAVKPTLGKKVGGWIFGNWGATPAPTTTTTTTATMRTASNGSSEGVTGTTKAQGKKPASNVASERGGKAAAAATPSSMAAPVPVPAAKPAIKPDPSLPNSPKKPKVRSPGINQTGPLNGFFNEIQALPTAPVMKSLDEEALRSVLDGA